MRGRTRIETRTRMLSTVTPPAVFSVTIDDTGLILTIVWNTTVIWGNTYPIEMFVAGYPGSPFSVGSSPYPPTGDGTNTLTFDLTSILGSGPITEGVAVDMNDDAGRVVMSETVTVQNALAPGLQNGNPSGTTNDWTNSGPQEMFAVQSLGVMTATLLTTKMQQSANGSDWFDIVGAAFPDRSSGSVTDTITFTRTMRYTHVVGVLTGADVYMSVDVGYPAAGVIGDVATSVEPAGYPPGAIVGDVVDYGSVPSSPVSMFCRRDVGAFSADSYSGTVQQSPDGVGSWEDVATLPEVTFGAQYHTIPFFRSMRYLRINSTLTGGSNIDLCITLGVGVGVANTPFNISVTNNSTVTVPEFESANVDVAGTLFTLVMSENVAQAGPDPVVTVDAGSATLSAASVTGDTYTATITVDATSGPVLIGQEVLVSFSAGDFVGDPSGVPCLAATDEPVTNNSTQITSGLVYHGGTVDPLPDTRWYVNGALGRATAGPTDNQVIITGDLGDITSMYAVTSMTPLLDGTLRLGAAFTGGPIFYAVGNMIIGFDEIAEGWDNINVPQNAIATLPALPSTLIQFDLTDNLLSSFPTAPVALIALYLNNNNLDSAAVDAVLVNLDANGAINGFVTMTGNAAPGAAGLAAKAALIVKGWTVTTD